MLSKKSISVAGAIVASLESVAVTPIEGSIVDQLTTEVVSGAAGLSVGDINEQLHQGSMLPNAMQQVPHDTKSDEAVQLFGDSLAGHFQFARHVVNPAINQITQAIIDKIGQRAPMHNLSMFSLAKIHSSPTAAALVAPHADAAIAETPLFSQFPERDEAELVETLRTGSAEFDADLQDMLVTLPTGWINDVYYRYFRQGDLFDQGRELSRADELLVVYLLAKAYDNEPPAGVAMSLPEYNQRVTQIAEQAANALNDIYRRYDRLVLSGALVWRFPPTKDFLESDADGAIIVIEPVYSAFIADGGTPEVIFGAAVSNREGKRDALLATKEDYVAIYNRFCERQARLRNDRLGAIARDELARQASRVVLEVESKLPAGSDIAAIQTLLAQQIESINVQELLEDTYKAVRRALCQSVFAFTDALKILERIDAYAAKNPGMTPGRAATLAAISLLVEHQLSQVMIRRVE